MDKSILVQSRERERERERCTGLWLGLTYCNNVYMEEEKLALSSLKEEHTNILLS